LRALHRTTLLERFFWWWWTPGVGTARKAIVVKSKKGQYFVLPDNGIITPVIERDGLESARDITNRSWMISDAISSTFHGRDIFSPTAAHLAAGWDFNQAGPEVKELVRLQLKTSVMNEQGIDGDVIGIDGDVIGLDDPYGSLITDVPGEDFKKLGYNLGDKVSVQIAGKSVVVPFVKTFRGVPVGESLLYIDSRGGVGIAVNQGNYATKFNVTPPVKIFIPRKASLRRLRQNSDTGFFSDSTPRSIHPGFAFSGWRANNRWGCRGLAAASTETPHARSCNRFSGAHRGGSCI
jgi:S-adenosylmethionine hydrolase